MNFSTFFEKAPEGKTFNSSVVFLSQDGGRSLKLKIKIKKFKRKDVTGHTGPFWKTKEEEAQMRSHLPSLAEAPNAGELFECFVGDIIQSVLGTAALPTPPERVTENYVSQLLSLDRPAVFFETSAAGDLSDVASSPSVSVQEERAFKRPRFNKELVLETVFSSKERNTHAQVTLSKHLSSKDLSFSQVYLAPSGFLKLSLDSYKTLKATLENKILMDNARRISLIDGAVISDLQVWLEKYCNGLYKEYVLDKGGEGMYH